MRKKICSPQICGSALLLAFVLLLSSALGLAQTNSRNTESPASAHMRALNNSLLRLHGQMQQAGANNVRLLRSQAATAIAQRAAALNKLIQDDPHAALTFAFSPDLLADLAAKFPNSAASLETHTTVTGPADHWIADYAKSSRSWWRMNAGGRSLYLYFAGPEPRNLNPSEVLQATGVLAGPVMAVETSTIVQSGAAASLSTNSSQRLKKLPSGQQWPASALLICGFVLSLPGLGGKGRGAGTRTRPLLKQFATYGLAFVVFVSISVTSYAQTSSCSTTGVQNVAVLMVVYPGTTIPSYLTPDAVYAAYFGTTPFSLADYWPQASYGKTSVTGNVFGWYTLSSGPSGYPSFDALTQDAVNIAASAGVPIQNYNRLSLVTPDWGGGWAGLAEMACSSTYTTPSGTSFTVSTSYVNGTNWDTQYSTQQQAISSAAVLIMHELGHNLGMSHSSSRAFTDTLGNPIALGPLGVQGTLQEYNDDFDAMSNGNPGHYDAPHKVEELNWIASTNYAVVQSSGTWTIEPLETSLSPTGLKALKIQRGTGNNAWLWVEYRQPIGSYDSSYYRDPTYMPWADQFYSGALIHYEDSFTTSSSGHTHLLDFTPTSAYGFVDSALAAGQTWTDPYTNLSISVLGATTSGMTVSVNYGATPCTHSNPNVAITPLDPSTYPGAGAGYTMSVTNNDSSGCSASNFTPLSNQPSGFMSAFSVGSISLNPGKSGTLTMTLTPPPGTVPGTYAVSATAANSSYVGTATGNLTVMSAPSLTIGVSVSGSSFTPPSTVPIAATVLNGGSPVSGASVTFTVAAPNGSTATQTATTGTSGMATWSYKLNGKSPAGNYSVSAQAGQSSGTKKATNSTQTVTSNTVNFTVQ